jgi:hypothetical protein
MSMSQAVLLFDNKLPSWPEIAAQADKLGYEIEFGSLSDIRSTDGKIEATMGGEPTAAFFEYAGLEEFDWLPDELNGAGDRLFVFSSIRGGDVHCLFAVRLQRLLCELADGAWWFMDFDDQFAAPDSAIGRLEDEAAPFEQRLYGKEFRSLPQSSRESASSPTVEAASATPEAPDVSPLPGLSAEVEATEQKSILSRILGIFR